MPFEDSSIVEPSSAQSTARNQSYKPPSWWQRQPIWVKAIALPMVCSFSGMCLLLAGLRILPLPDASLVNPTEIDSADGSRLVEWTLTGSRNQHATLADIPLALKQATLAVEDANFYHHRAFNFPSLGRAMLVNLTHARVVQGGSTITQQLAKNLYLTQDRTFTRKVKEALYAMQLELHETKDTILNQYLNVVYYGHGAYGVATAAKLYFNKPVNQLNLAECAMLAGLPKGPTLYSPILHFQAAKERQQLVLNRMVKTGYITPALAAAAYAKPLKITKTHQSVESAPYFTSTAIQEVEHRFHLSPEDLYEGGMSITTTLDPLLQRAAERAIRTTLPKDSHIQAALVAIDPQTGAIRAMVGGRNFSSSPYNRVFAERQPGSTFKAMLYTSALEHGWTEANQVNSELTTFQYGNRQDDLYTVHDYGDFYANRPLTLREAIARSDNVYAVATNMQIGPQHVIETAHKMGITAPLQPYPTLALGVFPTSPLQMATAYATLANGGFRVTPFSVSEVRSAKQDDVVQTTPNKTQVISPDIAYQMTDLLSSVLRPHGTGYAIHGYLHNTASAKTGTTDTDAWMVGYTPKLVTAVWVGYDENQKLSLKESHLAAPIWAKFMGTAQVHLPYTWYEPPAGLVKRIIDPLSARIATNSCGATEVDYFQQGTEPTEMCPLHPAHAVKQPQQSGILSWLRKWF